MPNRLQIGNRKVKLLVSELFRGWEGGSTRSLWLRTQFYKMAAKWIYLSKKRKLIDFGLTISPPNGKNRAKNYQGTAEILWCIWCEYKYGGARLTTSPLDSVNHLVLMCVLYAYVFCLAVAPCAQRPPEVRYGLVRFHTLRHGDRARYKCNPGFELVGDTYLTCMHGRWIGNVPTCREG